MSGFLYFFPTPQKQSISAADFEAAGVGYALTGQGPDCRPTTAGPGGEGGVVAVPTCPGAPRAAYDKARQTWRKGPGGRFWVGMQNDARPGPADLARQRVYAGNSVRLLDGNEWTVPRCVAVLPEQQMTLPRVLDLADDGETVVAKAHPRYAALCDRAFDWWLQWSRQVEGKVSGAAQIDLAIEALQVNYRIGKVEAIGLLGLWGTDEFGLVLRAMIDADEIEAYFESRKAAEAPEDGDGAEGAAKKNDTAAAST